MPTSLDTIGAQGSQAPSVRGRRVDPVVSSSFEVTIDELGKDYGDYNNPEPNKVSFSKISGIGSEITGDTVVQGTNPVELFVPKGIKYSDVTFERGVTAERLGLALMQWYTDVQSLMFSKTNFSVVVRSSVNDSHGSVARIKKRRVMIDLPSYKLTLVDAWPIKATFGKIDANRSQVWIYSMTMKYNGIEVKTF